MRNSDKSAAIRAAVKRGRTVFACIRRQEGAQDWPISGAKVKGAKLLGRYGGDYIDITGCELYSTDRMGVGREVISPAG